MRRPSFASATSYLSYNEYGLYSKQLLCLIRIILQTDHILHNGVQSIDTKGENSKDRTLWIISTLKIYPSNHSNKCGMQNAFKTAEQTEDVNRDVLIGEKRINILQSTELSGTLDSAECGLQSLQ